MVCIMRQIVKDKNGKAVTAGRDLMPEYYNFQFSLHKWSYFQMTLGDFVYILFLVTVISCIYVCAKQD